MAVVTGAARPAIAPSGPEMRGAVVAVESGGVEAVPEGLASPLSGTVAWQALATNATTRSTLRNSRRLMPTPHHGSARQPIETLHATSLRTQRMAVSVTGDPLAWIIHERG